MSLGVVILLCAECAVWKRGTSVGHSYRVHILWTNALRAVTACRSKSIGRYRNAAGVRDYPTLSKIYPPPT